MPDFEKSFIDMNTRASRLAVWTAVSAALKAAIVWVLCALVIALAVVHVFGVGACR